MKTLLRYVNGVFAAVLLFSAFGHFTSRSGINIAIFGGLAVPFIVTWYAIAERARNSLRWAALVLQIIPGLGGLYLITGVFGNVEGMLRPGAQLELVVGSLVMLLAAANGTMLKNALHPAAH